MTTSGGAPAAGKPGGGKPPKQGKPGGGQPKAPKGAKPNMPKLQVPGSVHKGSVTSWLNPMTNKMILKQATKTIKSAYAPNFQDLNQQTQQAQSLASKRTADNQYYLNWLNQQYAGMKAAADASNAHIANMENALYSQQANAFSQQAPNLISAANARAGNVSNNAQSNALGSQLADEQSNEQSALAATTNAGLAQQALGSNMLSATGANSSASVADLERANQGELQKALTTIGASRAKINAAEPGDIQKEIARLQGIEVQKAQYRVNASMAGAKLNLDRANIASEINARNAGVKISAANAQTSRMNALTNISRAQQTAMNQDRQFQLNTEKFNALTAKDLYEREHGLGPYKPGSSSASKTVNDHGATVNKPLATASQNVIFTKINQYENQLRQWRAAHPNKTPSDAWHAIAQSSASIDPRLLNAALSSVFYNGLNTGDVRVLHSMGVVIGNRLPVASSPKGVTPYEPPIG